MDCFVQCSSTKAQIQHQPLGLLLGHPLLYQPPFLALYRGHIPCHLAASESNALSARCKS